MPTYEISGNNKLLNTFIIYSYTSPFHIDIQDLYA